VMETVGAERDGFTRKQAEAELRERLVRVERKGYRRPKRLTFSQYRTTWFEEGKRRRQWKPKTVLAYGTTLDHLDEAFGPFLLGRPDRRRLVRAAGVALARHRARRGHPAGPRV